MNVASEKGIHLNVCGALDSRGNRERAAEKIAPPCKWLTSNSFGMLRHTAGCTFDDIDVGKSSLIDLEAYDCAIAA